jgi:hypothetical protein
MYWIPRINHTMNGPTNLTKNRVIMNWIFDIKTLVRHHRDHHRRDRMVVGFTTTVQSVPITTNVVSLNPLIEIIRILYFR